MDKKITIKTVAGLMGLLLLCTVLVLSPYRLERVAACLTPWDEVNGDAGRLFQALLALGRHR